MDIVCLDETARTAVAMLPPPQGQSQHIRECLTSGPGTLTDHMNSHCLLNVLLDEMLSFSFLELSAKSILYIRYDSFSVFPPHLAQVVH